MAFSLATCIAGKIGAYNGPYPKAASTKTFRASAMVIGTKQCEYAGGRSPACFRVDDIFGPVGNRLAMPSDHPAASPRGLFSRGDVGQIYDALNRLDLVGNRLAKNTDTDSTPGTLTAYREGGLMSAANVDEAILYEYDLNDRLLTEAFDDRTAANADRFTRYEYGPGADFTTDPDNPFGGDHTTQTKKSVWNNLTGSGNPAEATEYGFNLQGRMGSASVDLDADGLVDRREEYEYDDAGIRVAKTEIVDSNDDGTVDTTTRTDYHLDKNNHTGYAQVLEEMQGDVVQKSWTIGHDVFLEAGAANQLRHLLKDGHGSTRQLVDALGNVIQNGQTPQVFAYDAYGVPIGFALSGALTSLLYSGAQTDQLTGLQYLRARYYDPSTGTFNRLDPFAGNFSHPQSLHKYPYAHGNPMQGIDPSGAFLDITMAGLTGAFMWVSVLAYVGTSIVEATHALSKFWEIGFGGYDATNRLLELRRLLRDKWYGTGGQVRLSDNKKQQISNALHYTASALVGWDIDEMLRVKDEWIPPSFGPDRIPRTLTFRNKVYHVAEVNYIWWGMINRLLYDSSIDTPFTSRAMMASKAGAYRLATGPVSGMVGMFWDRHEESFGKLAWSRFGWDWAGPLNENVAPSTTGQFPYAIPSSARWPYWLSGRIGVAGSVLLLQTSGRRLPNA